MEVGVPETQIQLVHDGRPVDQERSFQAQGINDGAMLVTAVGSPSPGAPTQSTAQPPRVSDAEAQQFREFVLGNPEFQQQLTMTRPDMLNAVLNNSSNLRELLDDFNAQLSHARNTEAEKQRLLVILLSRQIYTDVVETS